MAVVYKTTTGNSVLDNLYDTLFGASPVLELRTGASPGPDAAATGTIVVTITAPATAFAAAAAKSKAKAGTWSNTAASTNTPAHYRFRNTGDTVREDGTVGQGSGDLSLDNTTVVTGQTVTISTFTKTIP